MSYAPLSLAAIVAVAFLTWCVLESTALSTSIGAWALAIVTIVSVFSLVLVGVSRLLDRADDVEGRE